MIVGRPDCIPLHRTSGPESEIEPHLGREAKAKRGRGPAEAFGGFGGLGVVKTFFRVP